MRDKYFCLMRRRAPQPIEPFRCRKRFCTVIPSLKEELPFKLRLLKNWKLTKELSKFLRENRSPEETAFRDQTSSQLALVPYQPNVYEQMLNAFGAKKSHKKVESLEMMEIEID